MGIKTVLNVGGMTCKHCEASVTGAVCAIPGVSKASADLRKKTVTAEHDESVDADMIKSAIVNAGYEIE